MRDVPGLNSLYASDRPDFMILGVQKSATTTLFDVLNGLDGFSGSSQKELHYFDSDLNYQKGVDWYLDFFGRKKVGVKRFEATPSYIYMRDVPGRIYKDFGSMKFVVMLRDPVKRCFSAWNMFRTFNSNKQTAEYIYDTYIKDSNPGSREALRHLLFSESFPTFEQCVNEDLFRRHSNGTDEEPSFVRRGFYYEQILRYLEFYRLQDFLFLEQDDFSKDPVGSVGAVLDFLGADSRVDLGVIPQVSNKGDYDGVAMDAHTDVFLKLYDLYSEPNRQLFSLIGKEYPWSASWLTL